MTLLVLRNIMRLLLMLLIITLCYWAYFTLPEGVNTVVVALFQICPLLLVAPLFINCRSPHLHIALPVIMIYMCFTAPNLFLDGMAQSIAAVELLLNILLSSSIMWYLLKASKQQRQWNTNQQQLKHESTLG